MVAGKTDRLIVGRIVGLYGVKGWVKVRSHTKPQDNIINYDPWQLKSGSAEPDWQTVSLEAGRRHGKGIIAKMTGINDRDQAAGLIGHEIAILREQLPELQEHEYYWNDLEGLRVIDTSGEEIGIVDHLMETGANDVLVVRKEAEEVLIPFLMGSVIQKVDLQNQYIQVDWHDAEN